MTVRELLMQLDSLRPNAYTDGEKLRLLDTVEGRIYREILDKTEGEVKEFIPFQEGEEERELAAPVPYTDVYLFYLAAMIDFYNGDAGRYNDTVVLFQMAWEEFAAWYIQNHKPAQANLRGMIPERGWRR